MIKNIILGIRRQPRKFFLAILFGITALWSILEPIFAMLDISTTGSEKYYLMAYTDPDMDVYSDYSINERINQYSKT